MSVFAELKIADLATPGKWSLNGGPFGSKLVSSMYVDEGVPVIRGANLPMDQRFLDDSFVYVTEAKADELRAHTAAPGDVVFTQRGTLGQVGLIPREARHQRYVISQSQMKLTVDPSLADPRYVYYTFRAPQVIQRFVGLASTSGVPHVNLQTLRDFAIPVPPLETQQRIAAILGAYDDLIEVNRRRVAVLEEMARGLFEGLLRSPTVGPTIGELYEASLGGDWGAEEADEGHSEKVRVVRGTDIPRLQNGDYSSCPQRFISSKSAAKRVLAAHDLVLENSINAKTRPAGTTFLVTAALLDELGGDAIAASFCRVFKFKSLRTALLVHYYCRHLHRTREIERFQTVAANGIANFQTQVFLKECRLPVDVEANEKALSLLESVHEGGSLIGRQISRLAASRDLLLPRLISGQLSVEAAERELEDAA